MPSAMSRLSDPVEIGSSVLIVGFPLGFHNSLHHLPVVRQAAVASAFGFGLPLTLIVMVVSVLMVPWVFPL